MPLIESVFTTGQDPEQLVARVRVDRTEVIRNGDVFPHFAGHQYYALSTMRLIDGPEGEWRGSPTEHELPWPSDTRLVEVVVRPINGSARVFTSRAPGHGKRGPKPKSNGVIPHEPFSSDKAAE